MTALGLITIGALLGVVFLFWFLILLHDKWRVPIPAVDWAILIYASILFLIGMGAWWWK